MPKSITLIRRAYWAGSHAPYPWATVTQNGEQADYNEIISGLFKECEIDDGDEFIITINKTGNRPFGDRRVILQAAHTYGPETDDQMKRRLQTGEHFDFRKQ